MELVVSIPSILEVLGLNLCGWYAWDRSLGTVSERKARSDDVTRFKRKKIKIKETIIKGLSNLIVKSRTIE